MRSQRAMRGGMKALVAAAILLALACAPAQAATILFDHAATGNNCFPFGCSDPLFGEGTRYQQVYNASQFSGPIEITQITFFNTTFNAGAGQIHPATYELHLSTTSRAVNALDVVDFGSNVGADDVLVFSAALSGVPGTDFVFDLSTPFTYDPADGNLLLDVFKSNFSPLSIANAATFGFLFLDAHNGTFGDASSRAHNFGTDFDSWGLVTAFTGEVFPPIDVPLPQALVLLGAGVTAIAVVRRRRA